MKSQRKFSGSDRRIAVPVASDRFRFASNGCCTPERLTAIMHAANSGDIEQLCLCGRDMLELNWDIIAALEQRSDALTGCEFDIQPGGNADIDRIAAEKFEEQLRSAGNLNKYGTIYDLFAHFERAAVLPFSPAEIVWSEGGNLEGFSILEPYFFTVRDGFTPRLVCDEYPLGMPEEMQRNSFVFHQFGKTDPARAGKIRVLAWLHCFENWPLKDLFSFIERFGMPFVIAKVDQNTWETERDVLHSLIRNFGPNGGGVFTKSTELELLSASNTGSDNVYFRALEFCHDAIYTLLVGQLASSGDSSGMSNGTAQSAVRQDILEADARAVESTVRSQIAAPWTAFHFTGAAVPRLHFHVEPAADLSQLAAVVSTLSQAGFKADPEELSSRFGMKLRYEPQIQQSGIPMSAEQSDASDLSGALKTWLGPIAETIAETAELADDELDKNLRSGIEVRPGSSTAIENAMQKDMQKNFDDGNKNNHQ